MSDAAFWFFMLSAVCCVLVLCPQTARSGPGIDAGRDKSTALEVEHD